VAIVDSTGAKAVEYKYDAWGRPIGEPWSLTTEYEALEKVNPFRYRGYVWDEEAGL
jgi:YD repeat-containing protein